jgi:hypothetical protein
MGQISPAQRPLDAFDFDARGVCHFVCHGDLPKANG